MSNGTILVSLGDTKLCSTSSTSSNWRVEPPFRPNLPGAHTLPPPPRNFPSLPYAPPLPASLAAHDSLWLLTIPACGAACGGGCRAVEDCEQSL